LGRAEDAPTKSDHIPLDGLSTSKPRAGCGWPPEKVEALIKDHPDVVALWREAITPAKHVHSDGDNGTIKPERGNSRSYTLSRLKRERRELAPELWNTPCLNQCFT
jgi:hypothetical protein